MSESYLSHSIHGHAADSAAAAAELRARLLDNPTATYQPVSYLYWMGMTAASLDGKPVFTWLDIPRMVRDPQVRLVERMWRAPFRLATWQVKAEDPRVQRFVDATLRRFWWRSLPRLLKNYFRWGHAPGGAEFRSFRGRIRLDRVKAVEPQHAAPHQYKDGKKKGQFAGFVADGIRVMVPHAMWFAGGQEYSPYHDFPPLAGMFNPWLEKNSRNGGLDQRVLYARKNASRGDLVRFPPGTTNLGTRETPRVIQNADLARQVANTLETGATCVMSSERYPQSDKYQWDITPPQATAEGAGRFYLEYLPQLDREMTRGAGIPDEVLEASKVGSGWSGRTIPLMQFFGGVDEFVGLIIDAADTGWLKYAVAANYGRGTWYEVEPDSLVKKIVEEGGQQPGGPGGAVQNAMNPAAGNGEGWSQTVGPRGGHWMVNRRTGAKRHVSLSDSRVGTVGSPIPRETRREVRRLLRERDRLNPPVKLADGRADRLASTTGSRGGKIDPHKLLLSLMLRVQERATARGRPETAEPYLRHLAALARDPDRLNEVLAGARLLSWEPYEGPRGGKGWQNSETGRIIYTHGAAPGERRKKQRASAVRAQELAGMIDRGEATPEHLEELAGHLPVMTVDNLRNIRNRIGLALGGKRRRAEMEQQVMDHVRGLVAAERAEKKAAKPEESAAEEPKGEGEKPADMDAMVKAARDYRYLGVKEEPEDDKAARQHQRHTTKPAIDNWLQKRFGVDAATARAVSNRAAEEPGFETADGGVRWTAGEPEPSAADYADLPWRAKPEAEAAVPPQASAAATAPYPQRPPDENEAGFYKRMGGRASHEVTQTDFLRHGAYEHLAGGDRRDKLVAAGLGTEASRKAAHRAAVEAALAAGKPVPPEVLKDYPDLAGKKAAPADPGPTPEKPALHPLAQEQYDETVPILEKHLANEISPRRKLAAAVGAINGLSPDAQRALVDKLADIAPDAHRYARENPESVPLAMRHLFGKAEKAPEPNPYAKKPEATEFGATNPTEAPATSDPLDITPETVKGVWGHNRDAILAADRNLSPNQAGALAAARILNGVDERSKAYRDEIDAKVRRGEPLTDTEEAKYIAADEARRNLYHPLAELSGYRPGADLDEHPLAREPIGHQGAAVPTADRLARALSKIDAKQAAATHSHLAADRDALQNKLTGIENELYKAKDELRRVGSRQPEKRQATKKVNELEKRRQEAENALSSFGRKPEWWQARLEHLALDESQPDFVRLAAANEARNAPRADDIRDAVRAYLTAHGHDPRVTDAVAAEVSQNPIRAAQKLDEVIRGETTRQQMTDERKAAREFVDSLGMAPHDAAAAEREANGIYAGDLARFKEKWQAAADRGRTEQARVAENNRKAAERAEKERVARKGADDYLAAVRGDKPPPPADPATMADVIERTLNAPREWHAGTELPKAGTDKQMVDATVKLNPTRFALPKTITEQGYLTDSRYLVKATPAMVEYAKEKGYDKLEGRTPPIKDMIGQARKNDTVPAKIVATRTEPGGADRVLVESADGRQAVLDAAYVANILKLYPGAEILVGEKTGHPVLFRKDGETVGLVMPFRTGNDVDHHSYEKGKRLTVADVAAPGVYSSDDVEDLGSLLRVGRGDTALTLRVGDGKNGYTLKDATREYGEFPTRTRAVEAGKELLAHAHGHDDEGNLIFRSKGTPAPTLATDEKTRRDFYRSLREQIKTAKAAKPKKLEIDGKTQDVTPIGDHLGVMKARPDYKGKSEGWEVIHMPTGAGLGGWTTKDSAVGHALVLSDLPGADWGSISADLKESDPERATALREKVKAVTDAYEASDLHPDMAGQNRASPSEGQPDAVQENRPGQVPHPERPDVHAQTGKGILRHEGVQPAAPEAGREGGREGEVATAAHGPQSGRTAAGQTIHFEPHPNQRADETTVMIDPRKLDAEWSKNPAAVLVDGTNAVPGKMEGVKAYLASGKPVAAPRVALGEDDSPDVIDGRHRIRALTDAGTDRIAVTVPKDQAGKVVEKYGTGEAGREGGREGEVAAAGHEPEPATPPGKTKSQEPRVGGYLDTEGNWRHGEIPPGAPTDGRDWLARKAVQNRREAATVLDAVRKRHASSPPAERVEKMGSQWWATDLTGTRRPSPFKTRKEALEWLSGSDPIILQNRKDALEKAEQDARESIQTALRAGIQLPSEVLKDYPDITA